MHPIVSVITPTTHDREHFNERIRKVFAAQDYPNKEHLFDYESGNIGTKRNRLCDAANGGIIVHFDSDDYYAPDWISRSVDALIKSGKDLTGLSAFYFYNPVLNRTWQYTYPKNENIAGATFCYHKSLWERKPFLSMQVGEDNQFVKGVNFHAHDYFDGFIATIHDGNTSPKAIHGCERYKECENTLINMLIPELMNPMHVAAIQS